MKVTKGKVFFQALKTFLDKIKNYDMYDILDHYGKKGVEALQNNTPVYTGLLKSSWSYKIEKEDDNYRLVWVNDDIEQGNNVALLIQYGFVTNTGYRVQAKDYINPALKGVYKELKRELESEVKRIGTDR